MFKLDTALLMSAIKNTPALVPPEMNSGTGYLFNKIYKQLSYSEVIHLSDLDFNAFDIEDIYSLNELFNNVFERQNCQAVSIVNAVRQIMPISRPSAYV
ncbi:MAG: hypothetical protein FWG87_01580 [Defluviitaleaceae bacterium]|nr:hypothetical protein [Defluviitaleaceae bacterium]